MSAPDPEAGYHIVFSHFRYDTALLFILRNFDK
jgi:hypothetical protein